MGQQQLLLLILAAIIVGIAIVMGINMFGENAVQANQDAVTQDVLTIASRAQGWYRRPAAMGGGGRSFVGLTLAKLNFDVTNDNGSYALSGIGAGQVTVTGTGTEDGDSDNQALQVQITVFSDSVGTMSYPEP
jgi:hypothetical protein